MKEQAVPEEQEEQTYKEYFVDIIKAGKPRSVKVRELEVEWHDPALQEETKVKIIIKKLGFGERGKLIKKFVTMQSRLGVESRNADVDEMRINTVLDCLHEAPFPINRDYIENELAGETGEEIYLQCEDFNELKKKKKPTSDGQSSTEE